MTRVPRPVVGRRARAAPTLVTVAIAVSACAGLEPVRPWQKGDLARPEMRLDDGPDGRVADKAWASRESASGGSRIGGGGCGCN